MLTEASTASDNCGEFSISEETVVDETDAVGNYTVTRTFTVTDDAGNSSVAVQVIVVRMILLLIDHPCGLHHRVLKRLCTTRRQPQTTAAVVVEEVSRVRVDGDCVGGYQWCARSPPPTTLATQPLWCRPSQWKTPPHQN